MEKITSHKDSEARLNQLIEDFYRQFYGKGVLLGLINEATGRLAKNRKAIAEILDLTPTDVLLLYAAVRQINLDPGSKTYMLTGLHKQLVDNTPIGRKNIDHFVDIALGKIPKSPKPVISSQNHHINSHKK